MFQGDAVTPPTSIAMDTESHSTTTPDSNGASSAAITEAAIVHHAEAQQQQQIASTKDEPANSTSTLSIGVPMSLPAILVNPKRHAQPTREELRARIREDAAASAPARKVTPEGRRRQLRSAHFKALVTGPGAARPTGEDYTHPARPNAVKSTFPQPMPPEVARALKLSREEQQELVRRANESQSDSFHQPNGVAGSSPGQYAVSIRDARRFLKERLGITPRQDQVKLATAAAEQELGTPDGADDLPSGLDLTVGGNAHSPTTTRTLNGAPMVPVVEDHALQRFADIVEEELEAWLSPQVYIRPDTQSHSRVIVNADYMRPLQDEEDVYDDDEEDSNAFVGGQRRTSKSSQRRTGSTSSSTAAADEPCIYEISAAPHSLRWYVPSPLLRYAVHCLARLHNCPSFSKEAIAFLPQRATRRETWILNPNPAARGARQGNNLAGPSGQPAGPRRSGGNGVGLETPPTTDIGTDVGTDIGTDSELGFDHDTGSSSEAEHGLVRRTGPSAIQGTHLDRSLVESVVWSEDESLPDEAEPNTNGVADVTVTRFPPRIRGASNPPHDLEPSSQRDTTQRTPNPGIRLSDSITSFEAGYEREGEDDDDLLEDEAELDSISGSIAALNLNGSQGDSTRTQPHNIGQ